jgi:SAM-dependent methyltransferase
VEKFDTVILSHVIEHMPDIIAFFDDIASIVKKNGRLVIIYPDARFCFDHFRNGTSFIDAYSSHKKGKDSSNRVFDFVYNVVHENNPHLFWNDIKQESLLPRNDFKETQDVYNKSLKGELPDDTHFWPFSDYQLVKFLYDMDRAGLLAFDIETLYETEDNTQEFMIILIPKKKKVIDYAKYKRLLAQLAPMTKTIRARNELRALSEELAALETENENLKIELAMIHNSKKWVYMKKIATIKNKITGKHSEKYL